MIRMSQMPGFYEFLSHVIDVVKRMAPFQESKSALGGKRGRVAVRIPSMRSSPSLLCLFVALILVKAHGLEGFRAEVKGPTVLPSAGVTMTM